MPEPRVAVRQLESVKVAEMDEEHERCADAMEVLCRDRTASSLRRVLREFETHFRHEEELLDEHLYSDVVGGGAATGFSADTSARKSHFADHKRILTDIRQECERINSEAADEGAVVPEAFAAKVVAEFEKHADQYDGHYADRMAESMSAKQTATASAAESSASGSGSD